MDENSSLPALIDDAMRQLDEARGIEGVLKMRDKAEALKVYAHKRNAAVGAQNQCALIVTLCERRIGHELRKARERGDIQPLGGNRFLGAAGTGTKPPSITDLGISRQSASEYQRLADVPEPVIRAAVDKATAESRPIRKREIMEAAVPKPRKAEPARQPLPEPKPHLRVVKSTLHDRAAQLCHLLARLSELSEEVDPEALRREFPHRLRQNYLRTLRPALGFLTRFDAAPDGEGANENAAG